MSQDKTRRIVLKLGTGILTSDKSLIDTGRIHEICDEVAKYQKNNIQTVIVSSGAVGLGMGRLGLKARPTRLPELQKCAAVGQSILTETWQKKFRPHDINVAQVLLTGSDIMQPSHNRIFGNFLDEVLNDQIIPIINENDSVSTDGFNMGDNDSLAALVACRVQADMLIILSTIPGLMDMSSGKIIRQVSRITHEIESLAQDTKSSTSVGGMVTKIRAARLASSSGCAVFIGSGEDPKILREVPEHTAEGTYFQAEKVSQKSRKRLNQNKWKIHFTKAKGNVTVDEGARNALIKKGSSLLAAGITSCKGNFDTGDTLDIKSTEGLLIARGISAFDSNNLCKIIGEKSETILEIFPEIEKPEVIHRDSLIILE